MYKKIAPLGSKASFPDIVSDIQDYALLNTADRVRPFIKQYGILTNNVSGVCIGEELKPSFAHSSGINFAAYGTAIFETNCWTVTAGGSSKLVYGLDTVGANAEYQLYINYDFVYSTPTSITDGFNYPVGSQNTKATPGYYIGAAPIAAVLSGNMIKLATGTTDGSGHLISSGFTDARVPLLLNEKVIDGGAIFKLDRPNSYNYLFTINSGLDVSGNVYLHNTLNVSGAATFGNSINATNSTDSIVYFRNIYLLNDSLVPYVYNDKSLPSLGWLFRAENGVRTGRLVAKSGSTIDVYNSSGSFVGSVITTGETSTTPQNLRLYDINQDKYSRSESICVFKWNYDDILLSGVSTGVSGLYLNMEKPYKWDTQNIDSSMQRWETITSGSLVGKYLYFPYTGNKYQIVYNAPAGTTGDYGFYMLVSSGLVLADALVTQMDPINSPSQIPSRIIDDADSYLLTIERVPKNITETNDFVFNIAQYKQTHVLPYEYVLDPKFTAHLPTSAKYAVKIQPTKKFSYGSEVRLNQDYNKATIGFSMDQEFDGTDTITSIIGGTTDRYRFTNNIPFTLTGGASVKATAFGFIISITGWFDADHIQNNPQEFEIIYTDGNKPSDWTTIQGTSADLSYTRIVTESRMISVNTVERKQYHIAVWPIMNGSRVQTSPIELSVTGGAGGIYPDNTVILDGRFSLKTYCVSGIYDNIIDASSAISPAVSGIQIYGLDPQDILGQVIQRQDDTSEFRITNAWWYDANRDKIQFEVNKIAGSSNTASGLCYINTTKTGRRLFKSINLPIDYQLTSASLSIEGGKTIASNYPGIVRIYQDGLSDSAADYIEVESVPIEINQALDETIQGNRSGSATNRTLIVDAYDPNGVNNICNMFGEIAIYATPLIVSRGGDRPIPNISL